MLIGLAHAAKIPALAVAVVSSKHKIQSQAVGVTNQSAPQKVTKSTVFEAASLSKPVFAYIVLKMVQRGELDLDQPLYEILENKFGKQDPRSGFGPPALRTHENYKMLTARMILSHQTGLPNWFKSGEKEGYLPDVMVGERFDYSGLAYCFLNEVLEKRFGKTLEERAQEEFARLGMKSSSFLPPQKGTAASEQRAIGHDASGTPDKTEHFLRERGANPAASLYTTAHDYAIFLSACATDEYIKAQMFQLEVDLVGKDREAKEAGVSEEVLKQLAWGLGMGLQKNEDGSFIAFHWGDNETIRNFAAIKCYLDGTYEAVSCFTNSANGPLVFRQVCEPVVGDLSAVSQWLAQREKLPAPIASSQSVKGLVKQFQSYIDLEKEERESKEEGAKANRKPGWKPSKL